MALDSHKLGIKFLSQRLVIVHLWKREDLVSYLKIKKNYPVDVFVRIN